MPLLRKPTSSIFVRGGVTAADAEAGDATVFAIAAALELGEGDAGDVAFGDVVLVDGWLVRRALFDAAEYATGMVVVGGGQ